MRQSVLGILLAAILATPAFAQAPVDAFRADRALAGLSFTPAPAPARTSLVAQAPAADPAVSVALGADSPSVYFFRGIRQEADPKVTFQPFVDVGVAANDRVSFNVGSWNSFHSGSTEDAFGTFYEADFYAAVTVAVVKATYTAYTSPADAFNTVHELALSSSIDDSANAFALAPAATVAFELGDFGADGGSEKGVYLELGVTPAIPLADAPISISIPVRVGLSLKDYYENPLTGEDDKFGYFSIGALASVPVNDLFEIHGGVSVLAFPDNVLRLFNDGESSQVIGTIGFGVSF